MAPQGYRALDVEGVRAYGADADAISNILGGDASDWQIREVGDGNLNLVFVLKGTSGACVVKQALPYVRVIGESWPLSLERNRFEYHCLVRHARCVPTLIPSLYHHDETMALMAMEYLTPHIILRKELIAGQQFPLVAEHMAEYMSQTLFKTSDLYLKPEKRRKDLRLFSENNQLCEITENVVFTDPYLDSEMNRWTSPQLDKLVAEFRADKKLKQASQELKFKFATAAESLLHGDLHSGSVMVTEQETKVIDPEFAFYGPMGFDVGALQANWLLAYFSQPGHEQKAREREQYQSWILQQVRDTWRLFAEKFSRLWQEERCGTAFSRSLLKQDTEALDCFLQRLHQDAIGFAGAKMVRRLIGVAHVEDMEAIENPDLRAKCEEKALQLGRLLMLERASDFQEVCQLAQNLERRDLGA